MIASATSEEETVHAAFSIGLPLSPVSWTVGGITSNTLIEVYLCLYLRDMLNECNAAFVAV